MIIALEGPDGVGKTTIIKQLMNKLPSQPVIRSPEGLIIWDYDRPMLVEYALDKVRGKYVFINERLPVIINPEDKIERSWTYAYYRLRYKMPDKVIRAATAVVSDRSYLSNAIYASASESVRDAIIAIEEAIGNKVDFFIILTGSHADKADTVDDVAAIHERYLEWYQSNRDRATLIDTSTMSIEEVTNEVLSVITRAVHGKEAEVQ